MKGSYHKNTSVIYIAHKNKEICSVLLNVHHMVLFKSPRDLMCIEHNACQMFPDNTKFMRVFADSTTKPYSCLLVDLEPDTSNHRSWNSKIFPRELQTVYIGKCCAQ